MARSPDQSSEARSKAGLSAPPSMPPRGARLLRLSELRLRVGLGRSTIYRRIDEGTFPRPRSLGGRAVAWLESDVEAWIAALTTRGESES